MTTARRPLGTVTRGTTNPNRLRRIDRFITGPLAQVLRDADVPLVVDLGYGASPVTTLELASRLRRIRSDVQVLGVEIEPGRVARGLDLLRESPRTNVDFALGGFELGPAHRPCLVRAANVLRQYDETEVARSWRQVCSRLAPGGRLVDATCNEVGRIASWFTVDEHARPVSLTISLHLAGLEHPGVVAERLPKALIHRNVPGEWVHTYLTALDHAWARHAPLSDFGARQRFIATCRTLRDDGWPLADGPTRWRLGEVTVRYQP